MRLPWSVLVCLLALAGCEDSEPVSPSGEVLAVPVGPAVQLDGRAIPAEWEDALVIPLGADTALRLRQVRGTLLVAYVSLRPWPTAGRLVLFLAPDPAPQGAATPGTIRVDYEPTLHDRPHLIVLRQTETVETHVPDAGVARADVHGPHASFEIALHLSALGVGPDDEGPRRLAVLLHRAAPEPRVITWPEGLDLGARATGPPRDYADAGRWARVGAWKDVAGPGAFPASVWRSLSAEEDELTRRGREAHELGLLIDEEPQLKKRDVEMVPELEGNLRWIAEREPLTPNDVQLLANGLRFLNRPDAALAALDALAMDPRWRDSISVHHHRALVLQGVERFEEAAQEWLAAAQTATPAARGGYERSAVRAREWAAAQAQEAARRREMEATAPLVLLETNRGDVVLALHPGRAPVAVEHFLSLVDEGYYDGTLFHRVIGTFLAQGGDARSREEGCEAGGTGEPPRTVPMETPEHVGYWRGAVAFARGLEPKNGSQFFVLTGPRPSLAQEGYTVFGHVRAGMAAIDRLEMCDVLERVTVLRR